jgi:hypothetical protein
MKLCIEGYIYFIPKFHILETGTVKLSIEIGLSVVGGGGGRLPLPETPKPLGVLRVGLTI